MSDVDKRDYCGLEYSIYAGAFVLGIAISALGSILPALFPASGGLSGPNSVPSCEFRPSHIRSGASSSH